MTVRALAMLLRVTVEFFWGEAAWGMTAGLRHLRWLRLLVVILPFVAGGIVLWIIVDGYAAPRERYDGNYSYYEGKILEERVRDQGEAIKRILEQQNTTVLLAVKQQDQIEKIQEIVADAKKVMLEVLVAIVVIGGGSILKDVLQMKFRKRSTHLRKEADNEG